MTDHEHANKLKDCIVALRQAVRSAKQAGLDVTLTADNIHCTSGARVSRNFYSSDVSGQSTGEASDD